MKWIKEVTRGEERKRRRKKKKKKGKKKKGKKIRRGHVWMGGRPSGGWSFKWEDWFMLFGWGFK